MAYNADNAPELSQTLFRDGEWFRTNASRSGTPVTQEAKTVLVPDRIGRNDPLRRQPTPLDTLHDDALATMRALLLAPGSMATLAQPHMLMPTMERVERTAMHGGSGKGERRLAPRAKQPHIVTLPHREPANPRVGIKRDSERARPEPVAFHVIAGRAVERGVAEREALAASRRGVRA